MAKASTRKPRAKKPAKVKQTLSRHGGQVRSASILAKFDAAAVNVENARRWADSDSLSADSSLDPQVRRYLRNRCRYVVFNDPLVNGMISTLANDCIGTGPLLQMIEGEKTAQTQIELAFYRWSVAIKLPQKLRTMRRAKATDGEAFGSLFTNPQLRNPVRLDMRLHEAEMIASPVSDFMSDSLTDGIIFDDFGNVIAYTLLTQHPGDRSVSLEREYEMVRSELMIHLFNQDRPAQSRGAPEIHPAVVTADELRTMTKAVLKTAELIACHSMLLKTQAPPDNPDAWEALDAVDIERGMATVLPMGWDATQMEANQPTAQFEMFEKCLIRRIARCLNMPYNVAAGDSSGYNYSSGRMDHQVYFKSISVERSYIEATALDVLFQSWWLEARMINGLLPDSLRESRLAPTHEWRWDGREHVDPLKEARAQQTRLQSRTTTYAEEYSKQGKDFEEQFRQISRERKLMKELGIEFEILPNSTPMAGEPVSAPESGDA